MSTEEGEGEAEIGNGDDVAAEGSAKTLQLQCGDTVVSTPCWAALEQKGTNLTVENFEEACPVHEGVAFEFSPDSDEFRSKVFAVRCPPAAANTVMVMLFTEEGAPLPDNDFNKPCMPLSEFMEGWRGDPADKQIIGGGSAVSSIPPLDAAVALADSIAPARGRVRVAFGTGAASDPIQWWGGVVDYVAGDGTRTIAMDDGTVEFFTVTEIQNTVALKGFEVLDPSKGGPQRKLSFGAGP